MVSPSAPCKCTNVLSELECAFNLLKTAMLDTWKFIKYSVVVVFLGVFLRTEWESFKKFESQDVVLVSSEKSFDEIDVLPKVGFIK